MTDRLDLTSWDGRLQRLESAVASMAAATAWAHLRGCSRHGACAIEDLQRHVERARWRSALRRLAGESATLVLRQWSEYCESFDAGGVIDLS